MKDVRSTLVSKEMAASIAGRHAAQNKIVMAGPFPPPVHGMSMVNAAVRDALRQVGVTPTVIDLAAPSLDRSMAARLGRLPRVLRGLGRLARQSTLRGAPWGKRLVSAGTGEARCSWRGGRAVNSKIFLMEVV